MKKFIVFFMIIGVVFLSSGCVKIKRRPANKSSSKDKTINQVKDMTLAKVILHSKPYKFTFTKDPFRPLIGKTIYSQTGLDINAQTDLKVIGIVVLGNNSVVLLESPFKTGTFKEGDNVGSYTIVKINKDSVVLAKGKKKIVLKVGGKNE